MTLKETLEALIKSEYGWSVAEQFENTFDDSESFEDQNENALKYINSMLKDILDAYDSPFSNSAKQEIFIYQRKLEDYLKDVEMADGGMMAAGGSTEDEVKAMYDYANVLFYAHINNGGELDYSDKEYGYLADELEDVEVGYFKDEVVDSDYANRLREEGFTLTKQEAIDILSHRIGSIEDELGYKMALGGLFDSPQKRSANRGLSWKLDHKRHNKRENYEIPLRKRKRFGK
jgi:hypothetical protein